MQNKDKKREREREREGERERERENRHLLNEHTCNTQLPEKLHVHNHNTSS